MARRGYQFPKTMTTRVVTPEAKTLFMCLADVNEYTGAYGGKLVFTKEQLDTEVAYQTAGGKRERKAFGDIINDTLEEAYSYYVQDTGKANAKKVEKFLDGADKDGNPDGTLVMSAKNSEQPKIQNTDRTFEENYDKLVGNGSTIKANLNLKPYVAPNGQEVGITAYLNGVLLVDIIEYGSEGDLFDDDDFGSAPTSNEDELDF